MDEKANGEKSKWVSISTIPLKSTYVEYPFLWSCSNDPEAFQVSRDRFKISGTFLFVWKFEDRGLRGQ